MLSASAPASLPSKLTHEKSDDGRSAAGKFSEGQRKSKGGGKGGLRGGNAVVADQQLEVLRGKRGGGIEEKRKNKGRRHLQIMHL